MNKLLFFCLSSLISISALSGMQTGKDLPEHIRKHLDVKPTREYTCRRCTPEEETAWKAKVDREKIALVKEVATSEFGPHGRATLEKMSDQQILAIYHQSCNDVIKEQCKTQ